MRKGGRHNHSGKFVGCRFHRISHRSRILCFIYNHNYTFLHNTLCEKNLEAVRIIC